MSKFPIILGSQPSNHSNINRLKRRLMLFLSICGLVLLASILVFMIPGKPTFAQGELPQGNSPETKIGLQDEATKDDDFHSVAACFAIPYGNLPQGKIMDHGDKGFYLPPNPDGPTLVDLGLYIIQITDIDELDNTFKLEGFMDLIWCDPSAAYDSQEIGTNRKIFLEEQALVAMIQDRPAR